MKRFSPALFGLAACAISLFTISDFTVAPPRVAAQSKNDAQARKTADIERELVRMEEEANELFMKREFAKLAEGWQDNVVFILLDGKIVEGRAAAQQGMQDSKERYDSLKNSENKLYLHGDVAMLTYLLTATGPIGFQARYTDVLVKQNGKGNSPAAREPSFKELFVSSPSNRIDERQHNFRERLSFQAELWQVRYFFSIAIGSCGPAAWKQERSGGNTSHTTHRKDSLENHPHLSVWSPFRASFSKNLIA